MESSQLFSFSKVLYIVLLLFWSVTTESGKQDEFAQVCNNGTVAYFSEIDADVFAPSGVERAAVRADVDDGWVAPVVDQDLPAVLVQVQLVLRLVQLHVQVVEHARIPHRTIICPFV